MRDPQCSKRRDMLKAYRGGYRPRLRNLFDELFPEVDKRWRWGPQYTEAYYRLQEEWIRQMTGCRGENDGNHLRPIPSSFRRDLNTKQRRKEKMATYHAWMSGEWDDFSLPRYRKNLEWEYW